MITVLLFNMCNESRIYRYDTNSFDEALQLLLEDWMTGKVIWDFDDTNAAITPEWLKKYGQPTKDIEAIIEDNVVIHTWHYCGARESDDEIVTAYMIKSLPIEKNDLPTKGIG